VVGAAIPEGLKIQLNEAQFNDVVKSLAGIQDGIPKVLARAINKAATGAKTDMVFIVREQYNYKAAALRDRIHVKKATYTHLAASTLSVGGPVHLTDVTGTVWRGPKSPGTQVDVKKITGKQMIKSAWIGHGKHSGKDIVYVRTKEPGLRRRTSPPGRYPIKALYAPHPEIVYGHEQIWKSVEYLADFTLSKALDHETEALLRGYTS
jgi:hypothetical protein